MFRHFFTSRLPLKLLVVALGASVASTMSTMGASREPLLVAAAMSLNQPLKQLTPRFDHLSRDRAPVFSFASSGKLQMQIGQGAPVDVFLSASPRQMNALQRKGLLLGGTRTTVLSNQLVVVVAKGNATAIDSIADLQQSRFRQVAIGDPTVPAGDYARQVLHHFGLADALRNRLVPLGSVRSVADAVASGDVDAGFVYRSDAVSDSRLRIVATAPDDSHQPILYVAAVIRTSQRPDQARSYIQFLRSDDAASVFRRYGFTASASQGGA